MKLITIEDEEATDLGTTTTTTTIADEKTIAATTTDVLIALVSVIETSHQLRDHVALVLKIVYDVPHLTDPATIDIIRDRQFVVMQQPVNPDHQQQIGREDRAHLEEPIADDQGRLVVEDPGENPTPHRRQPIESDPNRNLHKLLKTTNPVLCLAYRPLKKQFHYLKQQKELRNLLHNTNPLVRGQHKCLLM